MLGIGTPGQGPIGPPSPCRSRDPLGRLRRHLGIEPKVPTKMRFDLLAEPFGRYASVKRTEEMMHQAVVLVLRQALRVHRAQLSNDGT
jgi:hypothetical protein